MIPRFQYSFSILDFIYSLSVRKSANPGLTEISEYFGTGNILFTCKARVGLRLILNHLGLKPMSKIGIQPFTCSSVPAAIRKAGFQPVFIDIDTSFKLSRDDLRKKAVQLDALILTHTFGFPDDISTIRSILGDKPIIEDCSQALFSEVNNQPVGMFGEAGFYSFGYGKLFGIGQGGIVVTKNNKLYSELVHEALKFRGNTWTDNLINTSKNLARGLMYNLFIYRFLTLPLKKSGVFFRTEIQNYPTVEKSFFKADINLFLKKFKFFKEKSIIQKANGEFLNRLINPNYLPIHSAFRPNFFLIPLQSNFRDRIVNHLESAGIESGKHFSKSIDWVKRFGYVSGDCPQFEKIVDTIFTVPCHFYLKTEKIRWISEVINSFQ